MNEYEFSRKISHAFISLLKKYDIARGRFPSDDDIDAWEIVHNAPVQLMREHHCNPVINGRLLFEIIKRKQNRRWLECNKYYISAMSAPAGLDNQPGQIRESWPVYDAAAPQPQAAAGYQAEAGALPPTFVENSALSLENEISGNPYADAAEGAVHLPDAADRVMLGSGITMGIIGQGGMARVYKIYNQELSVYRAVKVIMEGAGALGKKLSDRMMTEAKIAARINHPNVIITHGVGKWNTYTYLEMEFVDGTDMANHITLVKRLSPVIACAIGLQICNGLAYAHTKNYTLFEKQFNGIIHRDLKPANIMLSKEGQVKIMDFGIARPISMGFHTVTGGFAGSLHYAAPEQLDSADIDQRTDIYSFGTVLYELLTGYKTFPYTDSQSLLRAKLNNTFKPVSDFKIKIPYSLVKIINKCITLTKSDRFETSADLTDALEGAFYRLTKERSDAVIREYAFKNGNRIQGCRSFWR